MRSCTPWILPAVVLGWLTTAGPALAQQGKPADPAPRVMDSAGLFGEEAVQKANSAIADLKRRFKKDLLIQTFAEAPAAIKKVDLDDKQAKHRFFKQWAVREAESHRVNGIYVLISTDPHYVQVVTGEKTRDLGLFTSANEDELAKEVIAGLKSKDKDEALRNAVAFVTHTLERNESAAGPAPRVLDKDGLFSEAAIAKANTALAEIKRRFKKDLLIETFADAPAAIKDVDLNDKEAKRRFFQGWAVREAKAHRVDGIYVLISAKPRYLQVVVGQHTRDKGLFTDANEDELAREMIAGLKGDDKDEALHKAITYVTQTLEKNKAGARPSGRREEGRNQGAFPAGRTLRIMTIQTLWAPSRLPPW
jgi:uncharacterized membrane protein YgcG